MQHLKDSSKNMCLARNWHLDAEASAGITAAVIIMTYNSVEVHVLRAK